MGGFKTELWIENVEGCGLGAAYGPDGFRTVEEEASYFEVGQADLTGIEIRLAVIPDECQPE